MTKFKTRIEEIIAYMSNADRHQLINDWEEFSNDGYIGSCLLRTVSQDYISGLGTHISITSVMKDFAFFTYKYFYDVS